MAYDPKPVSITQVEAGAYTGDWTPEPLLVVGDLPVGSIPIATTLLPGALLKRGAAIANVAVPFADLTAAANAHNALLAQLRAAGVIAP